MTGEWGCLLHSAEDARSASRDGRRSGVCEKTHLNWEKWIRGETQTSLSSSGRLEAPFHHHPRWRRRRRKKQKKKNVHAHHADTFTYREERHTFTFKDVPPTNPTPTIAPPPTTPISSPSLLLFRSRRVLPKEARAKTYCERGAHSPTNSGDQVTLIYPEISRVAAPDESVLPEKRRRSGGA